MPKSKKRKQPKIDKRMTVNQVYVHMQQLCETLEGVVLKTLHEQFGFGDVRKDRFMEAFKRDMSLYLLQESKKIRKQVK